MQASLIPSEFLKAALKAVRLRLSELIFKSKLTCLVDVRALFLMPRYEYLIRERDDGNELFSAVQEEI